jgi:hypothetical protein
MCNYKAELLTFSKISIRIYTSTSLTNSSIRVRRVLEVRHSKIVRQILPSKMSNGGLIRTILNRLKSHCQNKVK